jgi:hypothetical protein
MKYVQILQVHWLFRFLASYRNFGFQITIRCIFVGIRIAPDGYMVTHGARKCLILKFRRLLNAAIRRSTSTDSLRRRSPVA